LRSCWVRLSLSPRQQKHRQQIPCRQRHRNDIWIAAIAVANIHKATRSHFLDGIHARTRHVLKCNPALTVRRGTGNQRANKMKQSTQCHMGNGLVASFAIVRALQHNAKTECFVFIAYEVYGTSTALSLQYLYQSTREHRTGNRCIRCISDLVKSTAATTDVVYPKSMYHSRNLVWATQNLFKPSSMYSFSWRGGSGTKSG
jgi:hypothetical protein